MSNTTTTNNNNKLTLRANSFFPQALRIMTRGQEDLSNARFSHAASWKGTMCKTVRSQSRRITSRKVWECIPCHHSLRLISCGTGWKLPNFVTLSVLSDLHHPEARRSQNCIPFLGESVGLPAKVASVHCVLSEH